MVEAAYTGGAFFRHVHPSGSIEERGSGLLAKPHLAKCGLGRRRHRQSTSCSGEPEVQMCSFNLASQTVHFR
jgi:hypothetical protein